MGSTVNEDTRGDTDTRGQNHIAGLVRLALDEHWLFHRCRVHGLGRVFHLLHGLLHPHDLVDDLLGLLDGDRRGRLHDDLRLGRYHVVVRAAGSKGDHHENDDESSAQCGVQ